MPSGEKSRRGVGQGEAWLRPCETYWTGSKRGFGVSYVIENRELEHLEPKAQENRRRMGMLVCGCGSVCSIGGSCLVGARYELLHRGVLPDRAASPSEK